MAELRELDRIHEVFQQSSGDLASPCVDAGAVRGRLLTDPSLAGLGATTDALRRATEALLAVCGNAQLLRAPGDETDATRAAHPRWQAAVQRELVESCRAIQDAAAGLGANPPACATPSAATSSS